MKKICSILLPVILLLGVFTACSEKETPETIAKQWLTAVYNGHYEIAKNISTDAMKAELNNDAARNAAIPGQISQLVKVTIKSVKVDGDEATVAYGISAENMIDVPVLKLVRQGNKWLVNL